MISDTFEDRRFRAQVLYTDMIRRGIFKHDLAAAEAQLTKLKTKALISGSAQFLRLLLYDRTNY
jgi:hypothetical protein